MVLFAASATQIIYHSADYFYLKSLVKTYQARKVISGDEIGTSSFSNISNLGDFRTIPSFDSDLTFFMFNLSFLDLT